MITWHIILKHLHHWLLWVHFYCEKSTQKPKIAKLIIFLIFSKWRHSDQKLSVVVLYITEWLNYRFWPHFHQKAYSGGILKPDILVFMFFSVRKLTCFCFQDPQLSSCYLDIWPITHYLSVIYRFSAKHMTGVLTQFITNALILARRVWRG